MRAVDPLELYHSWALFERDRRFDLGLMADAAPFPRAFSPISRHDQQAALDRGVGEWSCDFADGRLRWSPQVFDLFGLPRDAIPSRPETVTLYEEGSRAAMERLRAHAIRHRRGFILDAAIRAADGRDRWMRLIAAPRFTGTRLTGLHGLKLDVSATYR